MLGIKRFSIFLCILALGAAVLSACSSGGPSTSATSDSQNGAEKQNLPATRTVKTVKGDVEIPTNPKRVVAGYYHGTLLALGIQPVGASKDWWMGSPFLKEQEQNIKDIGSPASLEKVLALQPDLIIINDLLADNYEQLSKIAPTVYIPYGSTKNIREEVKVFGDLLNKRKEAAAWLADYENKAKQARENLNNKFKPGTTAVLLEIDGKKLAVLGDNYGRGGEVIYHDLKFKAPDWVQQNVINNGKQYSEISLEALPKIANADYIFLSTYRETTEEQLKDYTNSKIWANLPAVKNGHLIPIDYNTYFYFDPVSTAGQIETLTQTLLKEQGL